MLQTELDAAVAVVRAKADTFWWGGQVETEMIRDWVYAALDAAEKVRRARDAAQRIAPPASTK